MDHGDLLALVLTGEVEGSADDALGAGTGVDLAGDGVLVERDLGKGGEGLGELRQRVGQFLGHGREFNAGIEVLGVLAEDNEVNAFLEVEGVAGIGLAGAQANVEVEQLPHAHDGRAIGEILVLEGGGEFGHGGFGGLGGDGAEKGGIHVLQELDGAGWKGVTLLAPEVPADVARNVIRVELELVENNLCRFEDIHADAIARQPCYFVFGHKLSGHVAQGGGLYQGGGQRRSSIRAVERDRSGTSAGDGSGGGPEVARMLSIRYRRPRTARVCANGVERQAGIRSRGGRSTRRGCGAGGRGA